MRLLLSALLGVVLCCGTGLAGKPNPGPLTVVVMERPEAPVFSFATVVNVGSAQEVPGITGLAHMFEHMAFKGTDKVGTSNYESERAALAKVEETYAAYDHARRDRRIETPDRESGATRQAMTSLRLQVRLWY